MHVISEHDALLRWDQLNEPVTDPHQTVPVRGQSIRFNDTYYEFSELVPVFGSAFVACLIIVFVEAFGEMARSGNAKRNQMLRSFLRELAIDGIEEPESAAGRTLDCLTRCVQPSAADMNEVATNYGNKMRDLSNLSILASSNRTYRATALETTSATIRALGHWGLWPVIRGMRRIDDRGSGHIKALGQLGPGEGSVTFEGKDAFARSVEASKLRLARLRKIAEDTLLEEYAKFQEGQRLLKLEGTSSLSTISEAVKRLTAYGDNKYEHPLVELVFPKDNTQLRLAHLLKYIKEVHTGAIPGGSGRNQHYGLLALVRSCGGGSFVSAHLEGTKQALLAAQILVLIDSGLNVQPCNDMPANPFHGEMRRGSIQIATLVSVKDRPTSKAIYTPVPVESAEALLNVPGSKVSSVTAIKMWLEASELTRARASADIAQFLWICPKGTGSDGPVQRLSDTAAKSQWNIFRTRFKNDSVLAGLTFARRNIRPTWLVIRASKNTDDHVLLSSQASHQDSSTTFGVYLDRVEYHALLASKIREFQNMFEAAILVTDPARIVQLAVSVETVVSNAERAIKSGLAELLFDADRHRDEAVAATPDPGSASAAIESLLTFKPSEPSLISLILVKLGLEQAEEGFRLNNLQRWLNVWMPGLALLQATENRIKVSKYSSAYERARTVALTGVDSGSYRLFAPW